MLKDIITYLYNIVKDMDISTEEIIVFISYLQKYGYLSEDLDVDKVIKAIQLFQELAGLIIDGVPGPKTLRAMYWPRCQCKDIQLSKSPENRWATSTLRYVIENRDTDLPENEWDGAIERAFKSWSNVAPLQFERISTRENAHLVLAVGDGPEYGFDGPKGALAWAQLPPSSTFNGQLLSRFDKAETWINDPQSRGTLLENVACHEIGHLLGLDHSRVSKALMAPFYSPFISKPQLDDDIFRIQKLYGQTKSQDDTTIILRGSIQDIIIPGYTITKN